MSNSHLKQNFCAILAALIWGSAFVAQSESTLLPFTFNALRSIVAVFVLFIVIVAFNRKNTINKLKENLKHSLWGGLACGTVLFVASFFQQLGIYSETSAGKAGFITALYIVLVPVFGVFIKKKVPLSVWISVIISVVGLYFLCIKEGFTIEKGDFYVFLCAIMFAVHILVIDFFVQKTDGVILSFFQFVTVSVLSAICMFIFDKPLISEISQNLIPVLYVGIFSSGIAYTLQIVAQKGSNPTVITILLSLESVFAVLSGMIILGDIMSVRETVGCLLMLFAVILAQIPVGKKGKLL